jgi:HEAT repeat protein
MNPNLARTIAAGLLFAHAATLFAAEPTFQGRTRRQWVDQMEGGQRRQRSHAAWALQQFAFEQVSTENELVWLNELLLLTESNSSSAARYWGAIGLGRMIVKLPDSSPARAKASEALPSLFADTSSAVRIAAADALLPTANRQSALAVLVAGLSHPQEAVRIQAATALDRWGQEARPASEALAKATTDSSEYVKRISTRALARLQASP